MRTADGYIVRKCLEGDSAAFGLLVEKYKEGVYALAYSKLQNFHDAEDATQEVFIKAYRKLKTLRQWESFHAWIYSITSNLCKDWLRAQSRRPDREFIADQNPSSAENYRPENPVLDFLHEALDSLPETYRQVLTLYYLSDMNTREIAEFLGMSPSAVRQRLSRARSQLKEETLAMMSVAYEEQRLPAGFTFRIVEAVKRIRIHPAPRITSVPWGLSLATGIFIAVLSLGPHLSLPSFISVFMESSPSNEAVSVEPGQMPVELLKAPQMPFMPGMQGNAGSSSSRLSGQQNAFVMAPRGEGITIPEKPAARLGKGDVTGVSYSPDGKFLLVYSSIGVWLYDAANPDEGWLLDRASIELSPDGKILASYERTSGSDQILLWDAQERRQIGVLKGHTDKVDHVAFSPDGQLLASGSYDKTVRLWNVREQKQVGLLLGHTGYVSFVIFSPDGRQLISCSFREDDRTIRLWDVQSQNQLGFLELNADMGVAFSPDREVWALYKDETIQLWDIQKQELLGELQGHTGDIYSVAFSPDGKILASSSLDETIQLWDIQKQELLGELQGHTEDIRCVEFSPDGKTLASCSVDKTIRLWDVQEQKQVGLLQHTSWVNSITFSPDNETLASSGGDNVVRIWNPQEQKQVGLLEGYRDNIFSLAFSPDGKILASGDVNGIIEIWDVQSQKQLGVLKGHTAHVHRVAFSPDGKILASGSMDMTVRLWDVQTQKEIGVLQNGSYAHCVVFSPDGKILASACGQQKQVRLWDMDSQKQIGVLQYGDYVQAVAFSPDGEILASGNTGGVIPLWDVEGQEHIGELKGHTDWIWTVTFSPDGRLLASASGDRTVCLWDVHEQERIAILRGHTKSLHSVAFSPDGKYLASSDDDGMVILWDAESHEQLSLLQKDEERRPVWCVAFSPDGKWLASGGWDNVVLLWEVNIPVQGKSVESTGKLPGTWGEVKRTALLQNFPNPFNPETWIPFSLSKPQHVMIRIYNSAGQLIRTLDLGHKPPGEYLSKDKAAYWDGTNEKGEKAASDVYFYVMDAGVTDLRKMVMVR